MGLSRILGSGTRATQDVLSLSHRLKMIWRDAESIATQVVYDEAIRNGADKELI